MSTADSKSVAFFGPTGGCTLSVLASAIEAGYRCRALVRTRSKLTDLLKGRGLDEKIIEENLVIVQGNAKDEEAAEKALIDVHGRVVDQIMFGIGGAIKFSPNPFKPTLDDPLICQTAIATVVSALASLKSAEGAQMPLLTAISTTGISDTRDIPLAMLPLYHWMLRVPHSDKKIMEDRILEAQSMKVIKDFVLVRPSLLVDGPKQGLSKIKSGWEGKASNQKGRGAAVGYSISREDVGGFVFEEIIAKGWR